MMWKWGTPKTSSWTVIPGSRLASPARRSLVASSSWYKWAICAGGRPSRDSTLSPPSKKRLGMRRRVSSCSRWVVLGGIARFHLQTKKILNRKGRKEVRKERKERRDRNPCRLYTSERLKAALYDPPRRASRSWRTRIMLGTPPLR